MFTHALTRRVLSQPFMLGAEALGVQPSGKLLRHLLPNTLPSIVTYVGNQSGSSAIAYASLAFIGLGTDPTLPDWGGMLFEYRMFIFDDPMLVSCPTLALATTVFLFNRACDR